MSVTDINVHPEDNPNTGHAAWQLAPRNMHTPSYPLNPHASFHPKFVSTGKKAWRKAEDPASYETIYVLDPYYCYPNTRVLLKHAESDKGLWEWQVWVTSLDGDYRWISPKSYTNISYAKQLAMKFRYHWNCLVVAITDLPDTDYVVGERVRCCNDSEYPEHQLGYCTGTVVETHIDAGRVKVKFDSHVKTHDNIFDMRIDHIYSLAPVSFSIFEATNETHLYEGERYKEMMARLLGINARLPKAVKADLTGDEVAAFVHNQLTAYPPRPLNNWHIEGYDKDGVLTTNHGAGKWADIFTQFMHPVGSIRRVVAGSPYATLKVVVLAHEDRLVKCRMYENTRATMIYHSTQLRQIEHIDKTTGFIFSWVMLTGIKDELVPRESSDKLAWELTDSSYSHDGDDEPCVWIEKWLIIDGEYPYLKMNGGRIFLTYDHAQQYIAELNSDQ